MTTAPAGGPPPLRVVVKGDSSVVWLSPMGGPRTDMAFPRALEAGLCAAGVPNEVRNFALPSERVRDGLRNWQAQVLTGSPDVVVLSYGLYESIHLVLPHWFQRHANSEAWRPGRWRTPYRRRMLRPTYRAVGRVQRRLDGPRWAALNARRGQRFAAELEQLILRIRRVGSPLVLVSDVLPPGPVWESWFPGMSSRVTVINAAVDEMLARLAEPDVRRFSVADSVTRHLPVGAQPVPDGGHFTPALHGGVGLDLARVITEWAATQPHLAR